MPAENRISFHCNADAISLTELYNWIIEYQPSNLLIMDSKGIGACASAYSLMRHYTDSPLVVHREWNGKEGWQWYDVSHEHQLQGYINHEQALGRSVSQRPEIIRYGLANEPSWIDTPGRTLTDMLNSHIQFMPKAANAGFRVALLNLATGKWSQLDIEAGVYDDFLYALDEYHDWHFLGLHEYTFGLLPFGVGQWPDETLTQPDKVHPANWPDPKMIQPKRIEWAGKQVMPPFWHLMRLSWFLIRCDELGIRRPNILITEWGWDNMPDLNRPYKPGASESIRDYLKRVYGTFGYDELAGARAFEGVWSQWWQGVSFTQAFIRQLQWGNPIYPECVRGMQLFAWNPEARWLKNGFHYGVQEILRAMIEADLSIEFPDTQPEQPPVEPPTPIPADPPRVEALLVLAIVMAAACGILFFARMAQ